MLVFRSGFTSTRRYQPRGGPYLALYQRLGAVQLSFRAHLSSDSQDIPSSPLPPSFLSLYRLFLRSTAASVLNQAKATSTLRKQWRPTFTQAAGVIRLLKADNLPADQREALMCWLTRWETRGQLAYMYSKDAVANATTLSPLYISNLGHLWCVIALWCCARCPQSQSPRNAMRRGH